MRFRGAVLALVASLVVAAPAHAVGGDAEPASAVVLSDAGDWVGQGKPEVFHSSTAAVGGGWRLEGVLSINADNRFTLEFAAPKGQALKPGVYEDAQEVGFQDAGRPGLGVTGNGHGCNLVDGRFEVRELDVTPAGDIRRLWIVFEQHCDGAIPAAYGEVRFGVPAAAYAIPALVRWPEGDVGRANSVAPVTLVASAPVQLGPAAVSGANPAEFPIESDGCAGRSLAVGERCQVEVGFEAGGAGLRSALLRIPGGAEVPLQAWSHGGTTKFTLTSDDGEWISGGHDYSWDTSNAVLRMNGTRGQIAFSHLAMDQYLWGDSTYWSGMFFPENGGAIQPRAYRNAVHYNARGANPGMHLGHGHKGCETVAGEFDVNEATFDDSGTLRTLGMSFLQRCDGASAALRGTFDWRKGDRTPPAPWMIGGAASGDPPAAPGGPSGGPGGEPGGGGSGEPSAGGPGPSVPATGPCFRGRAGDALLVRGSSKNDQLRAGNTPEIILAGAGNDRVQAGGGSDCVDAGAGHDVVSAGAGADRVYGGRGNDRLTGGPGKDLLNCGAGRDVAVVTPGDKVKSCERVVRRRR